MNKTKLEVIKINEDVIVTSCLHSDKKHYYSFSHLRGASAVNCVVYEAGKKVSSNTFYVPWSQVNPSMNISTELGKWYYFNDWANGGDGKYYECTGDHSDYTMVNH